MVLFYEPKDERDLARIEGILRDGGIEYALRPEPVGGIGPCQVHVAEEDVPQAEELLRRRTLH